MKVFVIDLTRYCRCPRRMDAQRAGEFLYSVAAGGYIFTKDTPRRTNNAPFVWTHTCPFCGGDLDRDEAIHSS